MKIDGIDLFQFRSYEKESFSFSPEVNIICGDNGKGKTNLLESLYLLTGVRSWRASRKAVLVRWDQERALLRARVTSHSRNLELKLELPVSGRSSAYVNGVRLKKTSDLADSMRCVLFSPSDLDLVKGPASERRAFLDDALCQMRPRYAEILGKYQYLLDSKNKLLRDEHQRQYAERLMPDYDVQLATLGAVLVGYRARFCVALSSEAASLHSEISGGKENLTIRYQTVSSVIDPLAPEPVIAECLRNHLVTHRQAELQSGNCLSGVHKDDLELIIDGREARFYASQGQTRSAALALKFAERNLFCRDSGEPPVVLLDDVLSELDATRRAFVSQHALGGQTVLTCCEDPRQFSDANVIMLQ